MDALKADTPLYSCFVQHQYCCTAAILLMWTLLSYTRYLVPGIVQVPLRDVFALISRGCGKWNLGNRGVPYTTASVICTPDSRLSDVGYVHFAFLDVKG